MIPRSHNATPNKLNRLNLNFNPIPNPSCLAQDHMDDKIFSGSHTLASERFQEKVKIYEEN